MDSRSNCVLIDPSDADKEKLREGCTEFKFPWGDDRVWGKAYIVLPSPDSRLFIAHQFADCCCLHAYFRGLLMRAPEPYASMLDEAMQEIQPDKDRLNEILAFCDVEVEEVIGQGLIRVSDGDYIMTEGND